MQRALKVQYGPEYQLPAPPAQAQRSSPSAALAAGSSWPIAIWWRIARRGSIRWRLRRARRRTPRQIAERHGLTAYDTYQEMLASGTVEVVDIAVPPDVQLDVIKNVCKHKKHIRGILAQKAAGRELRRRRRRSCSFAAAPASRWPSTRTCGTTSRSGPASRCSIRDCSGEPVLATIDMRAIPHWMPWQERQGWVTLRIMSIHHLDTFRYLFGDPVRVFASVRPDPRTAKKFAHEDGICLYILEYANGLRCSSWDDVWTGPALEGAEKDIGIRWRVEGLEGMARGTIGWPDYPNPTPSTLDFTTTKHPGYWFSPRWKEVWFPDAFVGTMAQLLVRSGRRRGAGNQRPRQSEDDGPGRCLLSVGQGAPGRGAAESMSAANAPGLPHSSRGGHSPRNVCRKRRVWWAQPTLRV